MSVNNSFRVVKVSATGSIVESFGSRGIAALDSTLMNPPFKDVKVLANGKVSVAIADSNTVLLYRFNTDGSPDTSFDSDGKATFTVPSMSSNVAPAASANGTIWLCSRSSAGMYTVRRVTATGVVDTSIGAAGTVDVWAGGTTVCAADSSGRLWVMTDNGMAGTKFGRFNADGTLDQSIGSSGVLTSSFYVISWSPYGAVVDADGVTFYGYQNGPPAIAIARITNAGNLSTVVAPLGSVWMGQTAQISDVRPVSGGFLVAAGYLNQSMTVVKALANQTLDTTFGTSGVMSFAAGNNPVGQFRADGSLAYIYQIFQMPSDVGLRSTDSSLVADATFGVSGVRAIDLRLGYFTWQPRAILNDSSMLVLQSGATVRYQRMNSRGELLAGSTPEGITGGETILEGADHRLWSTGFDFMTQQLAVYRFGTDVTYDASFNGGAPVQIPMAGFPILAPLLESNGNLVISTLSTTAGNPQIIMRTVSPTGVVSSPTTYSLSCCTAQNGNWASGSRTQTTFNGNLYLSFGEGQYSPHIVKVTPSGLDTSFGTGGKVSVAPSGYSEVMQLGLVVNGSGITVMMRGKNAQNAYKLLAMRLSLGGVVDATFGTSGVAVLGDTDAMSFPEFYPRTNGGFLKFAVVNGGNVWNVNGTYYTDAGVVDASVGSSGNVTFSYSAANYAPPPTITYDTRGGLFIWRQGFTQTISRLMLGGESVTYIAAPTTTTNAPTTSSPASVPAPASSAPGSTLASPSQAASPTTSIVAPDESVIERLPSSTSILGVSSTLSRGQRVSASASGFNPGETVHLVVASAPRVIGSGIADSTGSVTVEGIIPDDLDAGQHTLALFAPVSGVGLRQVVSIGSTVLPTTGGNGLSSVAVVMALFALVVGVIARRIRPI